MQNKSSPRHQRVVYATCNVADTTLWYQGGEMSVADDSTLKIYLNSYPAREIYFNFQQLEVVYRYRDLRLQVA